MARLRILGVHGIGHHEPGLDDEQAASALSMEWAAGLSPALRKVGVECDVRAAYYASYLNRRVAQAGGDGLDYLDPVHQEMLTLWASHVGVTVSAIPEGHLTAPARWLVGRMAACRTLNEAVLQPFVAVFLREVHTYLRRPDSQARTEARNAVAEAIRVHRPDVVIAHSFGSVLTYEAMCRNPDLEVGLLVTAGSPLGMPGVVFDRLDPAPEGGLGRRPTNVGRWVNIADPGDIVAVPRPFTDRFRPDANYEDAVIGLLDFHSANGYLTSRPLVRTIREYASDRSVPLSR